MEKAVLHLLGVFLSGERHLSFTQKSPQIVSMPIIPYHSGVALHHQSEGGDANT